MENANESNLKKTENANVNDDEKQKDANVTIAILEAISKNPRINAVKLIEILQEKTTIHILRRKLRELKDTGKIKYEGSAKKGGYYVI